MDGRLTRAPFVGRAAELTVLRTGFEQACAAQPGVVLVAGDSGVGKTRLVREFERRAMTGSASPPQFLHGEAVAQVGVELPFVPVLGAMRPLVRDRDPVLDALSEGSRRELAALMPGLASVAPADRHDDAAQLRLFEALLELLHLLSERQPVVLVLEDVHWADRSTTALTAFLARALRQEPILLLLTYRTDEVHRRHPIRPVLAELERLERTQTIELAPFDRAELGRALAGILGAEPGDDLLDRIFARTDGNALYSEELLAAGADGRGPAPRSLREAFLLRTERLSADAQRVVRLLAVAHRADQEMALDLTGLDEPRLNDALRAAVAEHVLSADDEGRLGFRHPLLQEVVYSDLLPGERVDVHLRLARWWEAHAVDGGEGSVQREAAVAAHYAAAGEQPAALRAGVQAAVAARDMHAYAEAADLAERALELWPRVEASHRPRDLDHAGLLGLAAETHSLAGDRARSEVLLRGALDELDAEADPGRYAAVLAHLARVQWSLSRGLQGIRTAEEALALLPAGEDSRHRASLLSWLARTRALRGRYRDALSAGDQALQAAATAHDRSVEAEVLNTLGMAQIALGDVAAGSDRLREAIRIAQATDDLDSLGYAYANLADLLNLRGETAQALQIAQEGLAVIPTRRSLMRGWLMLTVSEIAFDAGDWELAAAHLGPPPARLSGVSLIFRLLREADLALGLGDDDRAADCLREAQPLVETSAEPQWIGLLGVLLAELGRRRRDLHAARHAIEQTLDRIELCTDDVMRVARVAAAGVRVEADLAQRARDMRERADEREAKTRARMHQRRLTAAAQDGGPVERAWQAVGKAEAARARGRDDPRLWSAAAAAWDKLGRPYVAAQCRLREAEAQLAGETPGAAAAPAAAALRTARSLNARWLIDEILSLRDRARLSVDAPPDDDGHRGQCEKDAASDPFGLTARERQVLGLLAEGATNRQIGQALFMAEKTASVHVSRILAKLGVQTRTQAAAVAHRLHLHAG